MWLSLSPVKLLCTRKPFWVESSGLKAPCARGLFYSALWSLVEHARPLPDAASVVSTNSEGCPMPKKLRSDDDDLMEIFLQHYAELRREHSEYEDTVHKLECEVAGLQGGDDLKPNTASCRPSGKMTDQRQYSGPESRSVAGDPVPGSSPSWFPSPPSWLCSIP